MENNGNNEDQSISEFDTMLAEISKAIIAKNIIKEYWDLSTNFMNNVRIRNPHDYIRVRLWHRLCGSSGVEEIITKLDFEHPDDSIMSFVRMSHQRFVKQ